MRTRLQPLGTAGESWQEGEQRVFWGQWEGAAPVMLTQHIMGSAHAGSASHPVHEQLLGTPLTTPTQDRGQC